MALASPSIAAQMKDGGRDEHSTTAAEHRGALQALKPIQAPPLNALPCGAAGIAQGSEGAFLDAAAWDYVSSGAAVGWTDEASDVVQPALIVSGSNMAE